MRETPGTAHEMEPQEEGGREVMSSVINRVPGGRSVPCHRAGGAGQAGFLWRPLWLGLCPSSAHACHKPATPASSLLPPPFRHPRIIGSREPPPGPSHTLYILLLL